MENELVADVVDVDGAVGDMKQATTANFNATGRSNLQVGGSSSSTGS